MKKDKIRIYILELLLFVTFFFALILSKKLNEMVLALILVVFAIVIKFTITKKKQLSIDKKTVNILLIGFAVVYLGLFYLLGLVEYGFYKPSILFNFKTLCHYIIPTSIIIISSEFIRHSLISQDGMIRLGKREINLSKLLTFVDMVLIDLIVYMGLYDLGRFDDFLTVMGFVLFSSISCNLLYNYVSVRYGMKGIIGYRLITSLYIYIFPLLPNIYIYFRTFLRMIYPYIIYLILERGFSNTDFVVSYKDRKKNIVWLTILIVFMTMITMLISCQFKYGTLVVASGSMTGTINIGDAVVYESYDSQRIKNGDIIIFEKEGIRLVHRVIKIQNVNNEIRYFTKGDANEQVDSGYIVSDDIVGIFKFRVMYVGYPTIWVREVFS